MKSRKDVIADELDWHETEAKRRMPVDEMLYGPPAFDAVIASGFEFLDIQTDDLVLDIGCGEGKETVALALQGMRVVSIDLSHNQLCRVRQHLQVVCPQAKAYLVQANAEAMPFPAGAFRTIYGKAILHHLDLDIAAKEVDRVLASQGRATFAEPLARHPLFWLARHLTPSLRTKDEHPLTYRELRYFLTILGQGQLEGYFLLTPLSYAVRILPGGEGLFQRLHALLMRADRALLAAFPFLRALAWYGVAKVKQIPAESSPNTSS